ncbi:hypothetical protein [Leptospira adleri]|uniref:hypothetical protein n=1 Tax=Leptospira adleri TaxID=2023186 RepID=UPI001083D327|nr:hypothetical protein [Leptospira adleri]TGM58548.1 hypothetical protein EHQ97_05475 [Leptospira adleri]
MAIKAIDITFEKLDSVFKSLLALDSDKHDFSITIKEFSAAKEKPEIMRNLVGGRKYDDWNIFKQSFLEYQSQFNIMWQTVQGKGGPINLSSIDLPANIGEQLAKSLIDSSGFRDNNSDQDANVFDYLKEWLPNLFKYLDDDTRYISLTNFKEGFKAVSKGSYAFKFKPGKSPIFTKIINEYVYLNKNESQDELELGNQIEERLKTLIGLDDLEHKQLERRGGKYQNYDFVGFKKKINPKEDDLEIYTFELKASNKISSISEAISQATSYKSTSNYTYIIIPMFDKKLFHDETRFESFVDLCRENGLGIITIEVDPKKHKVIDVYEVITPRKLEILDFALLDEIFISKNLEFCQLCRRIASTGSDRNGCGWMINLESDSQCMKILFQEKMTKL